MRPRPTPLFGAVIAEIGYLQFFGEPFVMTQGGPLVLQRHFLRGIATTGLK